MKHNNQQYNQALYDELSISQALPSMSDDEINAKKKSIVQQLANAYRKNNDSRPAWQQ